MRQTNVYDETHTPKRSAPTTKSALCRRQERACKMGSSIQDLCDQLGVSKATIHRAIKRLDPDGAHITTQKRGAFEVDEYLCSLLSDDFSRDRDLSKTMKDRAAKIASSEFVPKKKISGHRTVKSGSEAQELKDLYEKLAQAEEQRHKDAIAAKDREIELLGEQIASLQTNCDDLKVRAAELEEKLDATRAQLDAMTTETLKNLSTQRLPWWKKLFSKPTNNS